MLLYLTIVQSMAHLSAHIFPTKTLSSVFTGLLVLITTYPGGISIHISQIPSYWSWTQLISPQRWLLPLLVLDEYSVETLANTAANQLCRNKQVQMAESTNSFVLTLKFKPAGATSGDYCAASVPNTEWYCNSV